MPLPYKQNDLIRYTIEGGYGHGRTAYAVITAATDKSIMLTDLTTDSSRSIAIKTFESRGGRRIMAAELPAREREAYNKMSLPMPANEPPTVGGGVQIKPKNINLADLMEIAPGHCIQTQSGCYMGLDSKDMILDLSNFCIVPKMAIESKVGIQRRINIVVD